jgi:hypothetical protein
MAKSDWVKGSDLAKELDCDIQTIDRLRKRKVFKQRTHYKVLNPKAARLTYRYHLSRCIAALDELEA